MKVTERDLMVARAAVRAAFADEGALAPDDVDITALLESLPEPAEQPSALEQLVREREAFATEVSRAVAQLTPAEPEQAAQDTGHNCYRCGSVVAERDAACDNRHWCDAIAAARAEAARAERERWMQTVDDNTGPTGGWLCSPKKLEQAATRAAQDEPGGKGE